MAKDANGNQLKIGSKVRVIKLDMSSYGSLTENELEDIKSMINEVFEIYDIDEWDKAWVEKWWSREDGKMESHSLGLIAEEMEIAQDGGCK